MTQVTGWTKNSMIIYYSKTSLGILEIDYLRQFVGVQKMTSQMDKKPSLKKQYIATCWNEYTSFRIESNACFMYNFLCPRLVASGTVVVSSIPLFHCIK